MKPRGVVLHTVGVKGDATAAGIRKYHVEHNGWRDIGYHFVVRKSGLIEDGRPLTQTGAHAEGANDSIGICVAGDGDHEVWTLAQSDTVRELAASLLTRFKLPLEKLCGHHEVEQVLGGKPTTKTCPGKLIDMNNVRAEVRKAMGS